MADKVLTDYVDQYGLICVKWPNGFLEGGDTCANEWTKIYADARLKDLSKADEMSALAVRIKRAITHTETTERDGKVVRHPDPTMWYSDPDRGSRDQMMTKLCSFGYLLRVLPKEEKDLRDKIKAARNRLFKAHLKNWLLLTWNTRRNGAFKTFEAHIENEYRHHSDFKGENIKLVVHEKDDDYARFNFYKYTPVKNVDGENVETPALSGIPITYEREWNYRWKFPDLTVFEVWGLWMRAYYPISLALLFLSFGLIAWKHTNPVGYIFPGLVFLAHLENFVATISKYFYNGGDDRNHFVITDYMVQVPMGILPRFSRWLYKKTSPIENRFREYWENPSQSAPLHVEMIELLKTWDKKKNV